MKPKEKLEKKNTQSVGSSASQRVPDTNSGVPDATDEELSEESYQAEHIMADEAKTGAFKIDPTSNITEGRIDALHKNSFLPTFGEGQSIFDFFFDVEVNSWLPWSCLTKSTMPDSPQEKSRLADFQQNTDVLFNNFWNTEDTIRYCYLIDRLINSQFNVMLIGPTGVGKSMLVNKYSQKRMNATVFKEKHYNVTGNCKTEELQEVLERGMQFSKSSKTYRPTPRNLTNLFFIDDLNMCPSDEFDIKSPLELLRSWFDYGGWFDIKEKTFKKMRNIQFCTTVSLSDDICNQSDKRSMDERFMWKFAVLTMVNLKNNHLDQIFK